jgi:hypothetical protein
MIEMKQNVKSRLRREVRNCDLAGQAPPKELLLELKDLSRTSTRMDLCALCMKIDLWKMTLLPPADIVSQHREVIEHHKSYTDLCEAVVFVSF